MLYQPKWSIYVIHHWNPNCQICFTLILRICYVHVSIFNTWAYLRTFRLFCRKLLYVNMRCLSAENLNNALMCENIFLSNHPCMCWRKRFGFNFNIFKRSFIFFYFVYCWLCMQLTLLLAILNLLVGGMWSRLLLCIMHFGQRPQNRLFYTASL